MICCKRYVESQKQLSRGVLRERCSENMLEIYRRTSMPKCDFNKVAEITLWHGCFPVNFLHIFRTAFLKNTSGQLLLESDTGWKSLCDSISFMWVLNLYIAICPSTISTIYWLPRKQSSILTHFSPMSYFYHP